MKMKKVLLTGCAGQIGGMLMTGLRETHRYEVIATARHADAEKGIVALDLRDQATAMRLFAGVDTVVHMAAFLGPFDFEERIVPNNVIGTFNLFEAMRHNHCRRMVNGSTNHVMGFYRVDERIDTDSPPRPDTLYGLGKAMVEVMGRYYCDKHGISCINIRIGHYSRTDRPLSPMKTRTWVSHSDMLHLVECCIDAPDEVRYLNLFGVSANHGRFWNTDGSEERIGYHPQDDGSRYLAEAQEVSWWKNTDGTGYRDETGYMGMDFIHIDGRAPRHRRAARPQAPQQGSDQADELAHHNPDTVRDD